MKKGHNKRGIRACTRDKSSQFYSCKRSTHACPRNSLSQLLSCKRSNSHLDFSVWNNNLLKSRRSQEVMGMPISTIFSIFLIVVFIVVAFYAISYFLNLQKCSQMGVFIDDFKGFIDEAWQSQSSSKVFSGSLPSGIEYACFANLEKEASGTAKEKEIYTELKRNADYTSNLFFYPRRKACVNSAKIEHINVTSNPYCFEVKDGKVKITVEKGFYDASVKVSRG